jgi:hypothetical protein
MMPRSEMTSLSVIEQNAEIIFLAGGIRLMRLRQLPESERPLLIEGEFHSRSAVVVHRRRRRAEVLAGHVEAVVGDDQNLRSPVRHPSDETCCLGSFGRAEFLNVVRDPSSHLGAADPHDVATWRQGSGLADVVQMLTEQRRGRDAKLQHAGGVNPPFDRLQLRLLRLRDDDLDLTLAELLDRNFLRAGGIDALD